MGLQPKDYLLDLGCGTLRGSIPIIRYLEKKHYCGIEVRSDVLEEGKKELFESKLTDKEPVLVSSKDISSFNLEKEFDYVWAFSVLIHMGDEMLEDCFTFVSRHLSNHGLFLANVNIGNRKTIHWQGFPLVWRSLEFYKEKASSHGLKVQDIGSLEEFGHISGYEGDIQRILKISKNI